MREAGAPDLLVLRADVIPQVDGDDRRLAILVDEQGQPVRQNELLVLDLGNVLRRRGRAGGGPRGLCRQLRYAQTEGEHREQRDETVVHGCTPPWVGFESIRLVTAHREGV